jgi:aryl-alcohol dehydrogenase-like predicted oxidoreductase
MVGARVPAEIEENIGAADVPLTDADVARIERIMDEAQGQVSVFRPFSAAMEVWS